MRAYFKDKDVKIYNGDCLEVARSLPDRHVNCIVTSPPYFGLRDYGVDGQLGLEKTPEEYVSKMVEIFRELRRVLRDDGTLWLNLGDTYAGSGGADGDYNEGGLKEGQPKYKNNFKIDRSKRNSKRWGGGNMPASDLLKPKDLCMIPARVAMALQADGWWLRQDIIWFKKNCMPESVTDRCTKSHEYIFLLSKSQKYYYDNEAIREKSVIHENRPDGIVRDRIYDYDSKLAVLQKRKRKNGIGSNEKKGMGGEYTANCGVRNYRNKRSVWNIPTQPFPEAHFAVFPPDLIIPCILAGCPEGGTVLDPFSGSGTTLKVARRLGRNSIGIELNIEYCAMQRKALSQRELF